MQFIMGGRQEKRVGLPDNISSIEARLFNDVLPTGKFLSRLPGIDQEYGEFVGQGMVFWNGLYRDGEGMTEIRISHIHQSTTFVLKNARATERWEMEEENCDVVSLHLVGGEISGSVVSSGISFDVKDSHFALISFCRGLNNFQDRDTSKGGRVYACEVCPLVTGNGELRYDNVKRPSDLPTRRVKDINYKESERYLKGFKTVQEVADFLVSLRNIINAATQVFTDKSAPIPTSESFISSDYFPPGIED